MFWESTEHVIGKCWPGPKSWGVSPRVVTSTCKPHCLGWRASGGLGRAYQNRSDVAVCGRSHMLFGLQPSATCSQSMPAHICTHISSVGKSLCNASCVLGRSHVAYAWSLCERAIHDERRLNIDKGIFVRAKKFLSMTNTTIESLRSGCPNYYKWLQLMWNMNRTSPKLQDFNCAPRNYFLKSNTITLAYLPIMFWIMASLTHNILIDYLKIIILHEITIARVDTIQYYILNK